MSQNSDPTTNSTESKESEVANIEYSVGDYVELQGNKKNTRKGYIRFKGKMKEFGDCVGVELDNKIDNGNNGTVNEEKYFECDEGKGTFIKLAKIIRKLPMKPKNGTVQTSSDESDPSNDKNAESFPATPALIEQSEEDQIKHKKKKKKKKKPKDKDATSNGVKKSTKKSKTTKDSNKPSKKSRKSKTTKESKSSKKKTEKTDQFIIPKTGANKDKLKFVYARLNAAKSPFKKRVQLMKNTIPIVEDEKCDDKTSKFAVDGYKKCFVAQLTDRKKSVHIEALKLLDAIIKSYPKQFKLQILHYLKHTMSHLEKCDTKTQLCCEASIKLMINAADSNKSLGIVIAELIRFGTSAKNKKSRSHGWKFLAVILKRYEPTKGQTKGKKKIKKPSKGVLDALQTGLKQGLAERDKNTQKEAMLCLNSMSFIDEARGERIIARMSPAARRNFDKFVGRDKGRSLSITADLSVGMGVKKPKTPKPKRTRTPKTKKPKTPKVKETKPKGKRNSSKKELSKHGRKGSKKEVKTSKGKKESKLKKGNSKGSVKGEKGKKTKGSKGKKTKGDKTKGKANKSPKDKTVESSETNGSVTPGKDDDSKVKDEPIKEDKVEVSATDEETTTDSEVSVVSTTTAESYVTDADTATDTTENGTPSMSDTNSTEIEESTTTEAYVKAEAKDEDKTDASTTEESSEDKETYAFDDNGVGDTTDESEETTHVSNHTLEDSNDFGDDIIDDDDDDIPDSSDESSSSDEEDGGIMDGGSSENDARDLIESFLDLKDPQINWKMIEFLSKDNMTHLLMSYISRMPQGPKIWQENLEIDMTVVIPPTKALFSDETDEIRLTQLSYSLMRILSNEHCAETVKSFLLRKCQEICLHALAVFHPLSVGNVYHGRVVLEILLNHWPKSFMAALANQRHIQSLLKCALFRNLHQGNLNSFFLDLICFRPNTKIGQIQPVKKKLISMFVEWEFMQYLLEVSTSMKNGDDIATKYATFFIDMVARCASISEAQELFLGFEHLIIDSFMNGLLNHDLSIWHRISCGQTLVQFLDISSRPTIMDPASAMAGMLGVVAPDPMTNILHPMFEKSLSRLHTFIPKMCATITDKSMQADSVRLACGNIPKPFGQVKLNCLELLTVSADFAQFKCGTVLGLLPFDFWSELLNMAFIHPQNNMFLCHFRRLIHLSMIFRRRFLKHLFVSEKLLERFVDYYQNKPEPRCTLHGYILQMLWDIYNHDQRDEDEMDGDEQKENSNEDSEEENEQRSSVVINEEYMPEVERQDSNEDNVSDGNDNDSEAKEENDDNDSDEFGDDVVLKPNFSKETEDQWDIVAFFNNNKVWQQFMVTVSFQMEAQNATEPQVPNMNVASNQQQLDQLLQNLLGPNEETSDSSDSDSDSDED